MEPDVLVAGGGIAGLGAAIACSRAGLETLVVERAADAGRLGAGIALWPNALRALDALGVGDAVRAAAAAVGGSRILRPDGRALGGLDGDALAARTGDRVHVIERGALHALLAAAAGAVVEDAVVGATAAQGAPAVALASGPVVRPRLLVGADGIRSAVRAAVAPEVAPRRTGLIAWRGIASAELPWTIEIWGDGLVAGAAPLPGGRVYWWAAGREDDDIRGQVAAWPAARPFAAALTAVDAFARPLEVLPDVVPLAHGRTLLVGDASHAMAPYLGQGGCQALEDAAALGVALAAGGVEGAPARVDAARRGRARLVQRQSWRQARVAHLAGPAAALRDAALRATPASVALRAATRLVA